MRSYSLIMTVALAAPFSVGAATLDAQDFCTGDAPDENTESVKAEIYKGSTCKEIRTLWLERAKSTIANGGRSDREARKDSERENLSANMDLLKKISESVKPTEKELPKLEAFISNSQRHISDLAYHSGVNLGNVIQSRQALGKTLILSSPEEASQWLNSAVVQNTLKKLREIESKSKSILTSAGNCLPQQKQTGTKQKSGIVALASTLSAAKTVMDGIAALAYNFQPQVSGSTAVQPPGALKASMISGFQTGYNSAASKSGKATTVFYSRPPLISPANEVIDTANRTAAILKQTVDRVEDMNKKLKPNEEYSVFCMTVIEPLNGAATSFQMLNARDLTPESGSVIEQAARQKSLADMKITHFVLLNVVVSGGAVTGYQRNRFSAVKLISSADISAVAEVYSADGSLAATTYQSQGCGSAIALGEFSTSYKASDCRAQEE